MSSMTQELHLIAVDQVLVHIDMIIKSIPFKRSFCFFPFWTKSRGLYREGRTWKVILSGKESGRPRHTSPARQHSSSASAVCYSNSSGGFDPQTRRRLARNTSKRCKCHARMWRRHLRMRNILRKVRHFALSCLKLQVLARPCAVAASLSSHTWYQKRTLLNEIESFVSVLGDRLP